MMRISECVRAETVLESEACEGVCGGGEVSKCHEVDVVSRVKLGVGLLVGMVGALVLPVESGLGVWLGVWLGVCRSTRCFGHFRSAFIALRSFV